MKSYSQAGQDRFLHALLPHSGGTFVDIGCSHPTELSNTYALESELGWTGLLLDSNINACDLCRAQRRARVICADAATVDWAAEMGDAFPKVIDYASVDVDEWTHKALRRLLESSGRLFRVMTVEHDYYQRGDRLRLPNRDLLNSYGYKMIAGDVKSAGCVFEDWWVLPGEVDEARAERFRSTGLPWEEVLKQGGAS